MQILTLMVLFVVTLLLAAAAVSLWRQTLRLKGLLDEARTRGLQLAAEVESLRVIKDRLREAQDLAGLKSWDWELQGPPDKWLGQTFRLLSLVQEQDGLGLNASLRSIHSDDVEELRQRISTAIAGGGSFEAAFRTVGGDGEVRYLRARASVYRGDADTPPRILGTVLDVTDMKRTEEELRRIATTDALTGAYTRGQFFELARHEFERWQRYHDSLAVMMVDVDHFKELNDGFGHLYGDKALQAIARTCRRTLRRTDILGRYGGDEFAVVLPSSDLDAALDTAERLRRAVAELALPLSGDRGAEHLSLSLGVAVAEQDDEDLEQIFKRADRALYDAKEGGRNRVARR